MGLCGIIERRYIMVNFLEERKMGMESKLTLKMDAILYGKEHL